MLQAKQDTNQALKFMEEYEAEQNDSLDYHHHHSLPLGNQVTQKSNSTKQQSHLLLCYRTSFNVRSNWRRNGRIWSDKISNNNIKNHSKMCCSQMILIEKVEAATKSQKQHYNRSNLKSKIISLLGRNKKNSNSDQSYLNWNPKFAFGNYLSMICKWLYVRPVRWLT